VQALQRADQIEYAEGKVTRDYFLPIVADAGELVERLVKVKGGLDLPPRITVLHACAAARLRLVPLQLLHVHAGVHIRLGTSTLARSSSLLCPRTLSFHCRGWLWRPPERLRADQAPDRGGRCRR